MAAILTISFIILCIAISGKMRKAQHTIETQNKKIEEYKSKYKKEEWKYAEIKLKQEHAQQKLDRYNGELYDLETGVVNQIGEDHLNIKGHNEHLAAARVCLKSYINNDVAINNDDCDYPVSERTEINVLVAALFNSLCENILLKNKNAELEEIREKIEIEKEIVAAIAPCGFVVADRYCETKIEEALLIVQRERRKRNKEFDDIAEKGREHIKTLEEEVDAAKLSIRALNKTLTKLSESDCVEIRAEITKLEEKLSESLKTLADEEEVLKNKYKGWIYFISNPQIPGQLKIGMSRRSDVMVRIDELSSSAGLAFTMNVLGVIPVDHVFEVETSFHNYFREKIINEKKEWFGITVAEAQAAIIEKGFELVLKDDIVHVDYERCKERLNKIGIEI